MNEHKNPLGDILTFSDSKNVKTANNPIRMEVAMQWCNQDYNDNLISYANNVRTHDGGSHETGFKAGLTRAVNDWAIQNGLLKETQKVDGNDIREGLTAVISVQIPENILQYESQTKAKLDTAEVTPLLNDFVYTNLMYFLTEHKAFAIDLVKKCSASKQAREAARKAKEAARNGKAKKNDAVISDKLAAAQSKD